jgi:OB-fold nucleic acid binding domain
MAARLARNAQLEPDKTGWNFYLCVRKDVRVGKGGEYLALVLQDASGQVAGRVFDGVDRLKHEFEVGEFVRVEGRTSVHNGELQLVASSLRRVHAAQDEAQGFREDECVPSAPRPIGDMWAELLALVAGLADGPLRVLLNRLLTDHETALREWPAAQQIHHAYRGGLLEHVLTMASAMPARSSTTSASSRSWPMTTAPSATRATAIWWATSPWGWSWSARPRVASRASPTTCEPSSSTWWSRTTAAATGARRWNRRASRRSSSRRWTIWTRACIRCARRAGKAAPIRRLPRGTSAWGACCTAGRRTRETVGGPSAAGKPGASVSSPKSC